MRLFENIIKNAVEASGERDVMVLVKYDQNQKLVIRVHDSGAGLKAETFERATRGESVVTDKEQGLGLGLRSAIECARGLDADIKLIPQANGGKGSCIEVSLSVPCLEKSERAGIIVVDDDEVMKALWKCWAKENNILITFALPHQVPETLNCLPKSVKWLVLDYDLKLPNFTGASIAQAFSGRNLKLALCTGFDFQTLPDDARKISWTKILTKSPQDPETAVPAYSILEQSNEAFRDVVTTSVVTPRDQALSSEQRHFLRSTLSPIKLSVELALKSKDRDPMFAKIAGALTSSIQALEKLVKRAPLETARRADEHPIENLEANL